MTRPNLNQIRLELAAGLPLRTRWLIHETTLDFDFARCQNPLVSVDRLMPVGFEPDCRSASLFAFGEQDYAEGGGASPYLVIDRTSGEVLELDLETSNDPIRFLNSSSSTFVLTFAALERAIRLRETPIADLKRQLEAIDFQGFHRSHWRLLVEEAADANWVTL